ncbi:MAG: hypothetical protein Q4F35_02495 [Akkermansia sp.]|nr:hypothetical protein [Akkermansia sp.]
MKKTLRLFSLLSSLSTTFAATGDIIDLTQGYVADGVAATFSGGNVTFGKDELQKSTRFYDSQKGWVADTKYGDSQMCWAHTASNMIQYWQSYYGVFYKGSTPLPYGSDYKRELYNIMNPSNSPIITDPMRLQVMKALKNSGFPNSGNEVAAGTNWFFTWVDSQGGYYSDYFGAIHSGQSNPDGQTATITAVNSLSTLKSALLPALGLTESNGTCRQTESGLIAHLNVTNGESPHTLTCYGLTTHEDGSIKSLLIADSDDCRLPSYEGTTGSTGSSGTYMPRLTQLFVQAATDGKLALYSDAAYSTPFISGYTYYISGVTQINTPEVLKNMLAEYSDTENEAQVWNGSSSTWDVKTADTNALPTEATGWDILVDGNNIDSEHRGYYHTYAADGRSVEFGDHAAENQRDVTIVGTVSAQNIEVTATGYHFTAGEGAALTAAQDGGTINIRNGASLTSEVALTNRTVLIEDNALLELTRQASVQLRDVTLQGSATISTTESGATIVVTGNFTATSRGAATPVTFDLRSSIPPEPNLYADLDLTGATSVTLDCKVNMNGHELRLSESTPITLNLSTEGTAVPFFSNIGKLFIGEQEISYGTDLSSYLTITNEADFPGYTLSYTDGMLSMAPLVPEPTTTTLGVLALAALTSRRRRR